MDMSLKVEEVIIVRGSTGTGRSPLSVVHEVVQVFSKSGDLIAEAHNVDLLKLEVSADLLRWYWWFRENPNMKASEIADILKDGQLKEYCHLTQI